MVWDRIEAGRARGWITIVLTVLVACGAVACTGGDGGGGEPSAAPTDAANGGVVDGAPPALVELRDESEAEFLAAANDDGRVRSVVGSFPTGGGAPTDEAISFLQRHATVFGLDRPGIGLEPTSVRDFDDAVTVRLGQTYRGIPVDDGGFVVTLDDGSIRSVSGGGLAPIQMEVIPAISATDATSVAAEGLPAAEVIGVPHLSITQGADRSFRLTWLVDLSTPGGVLAARVDARSGDLVGRPSAGLHDLVDKDLEVFDDRGTRSDDIQYDSSCVGDGPTAGDEEGYLLSAAATPNAHTVWQNTIAVIKWYDSKFGWLGFDDDDTPQVEVHADVTMDRETGSIAASGMYVNHCEDIIIGVGHHADKRLLGHEYTHGVQDHVGSVDYAGQSGAIAEGLANVIGRAFAGTVAGLDDSMTLSDYADGCGVNVDVEDCYDHGNVHLNDAIVEHFFRLISKGGAGGAVRPAGDFKMARLAFGSMFVIPSDVTISELLHAAEGRARYWAALGLHGFTFDDVCTVTKAMAQIAGGPGYCSYPSDSLDDDGDGIPNGRDGCDNRYGNDFDGDGVVSECDDDDDGDGLLDDDDKCPAHWDPTNADNDRDGLGDPCDTNDDGDNHLDSVDNCPLVKNSDQIDSDRDGQGDACDDIDGDGVIDSEDNCPFDWNAGQSNIDGDNLGDACESDADGDGVDDSLDTDGTTDNCQWYPNADQADADGDGLGDVCDPCPAGVDFVTGYTANPFNTGGELPAGLPGGLGDDFIPGTIVSDQDGDGIPDGCDQGVVLLDLGVAGLRRAVPMVPGSGTVTIPGEQPPGGTFDLPDPCGPAGGSGDEGDPTGSVTISGAPVDVTASLVGATGRVLSSADLIGGAATLSFEVGADTDLHLRIGAEGGPLQPGLRADYEFVACGGEEESVGAPPSAYGDFSELIPREEYERRDAERPLSTTTSTTATEGGEQPTSTAETTSTVAPGTSPTTSGCASTTTTGRATTTSTTTRPTATTTTEPCSPATTATTTGTATPTTRPTFTTTTAPVLRTTTTTRPVLRTTTTTTTTRPVFTTTTRPVLQTTTTTRPVFTTTTRPVFQTTTTTTTTRPIFTTTTRPLLQTTTTR